MFVVSCARRRGARLSPAALVRGPTRARTRIPNLAIVVGLKTRDIYIHIFLIHNNSLKTGFILSAINFAVLFVVGTRLHFHELVEFQRGRCGDDMKCVRPDQEMRALYRFLRRHPCIGLALDPVRGGRPRAQPVVFVVARTECG